VVARSARNARAAVAALERQQAAPQPAFDVRIVDVTTRGERAVADALATANTIAPASRICIFLADGYVPGPALVATHVAAQSGDARVVAAGPAPPASDAPVELRNLGGGSLSLPAEALTRQSPGGEAPVADLILRLHELGYEVRLADDGGEPAAPESSHAARAQRGTEGGAHALLAAHHPAAMRLLLAWFADAPPRELLLRRALLRLGITPRLLAAAGRLLPFGEAGERWSAFAAGCAYWCGVRRRLPAAEWRRLARATPVLLYHAFGDDVPTSRFVCSPASLALQMRVLSLLRYRVIGFEELCRLLRDGIAPPPRTAVVTADDGYLDNRVLAAALARHRFRGTIFLVSDGLGRHVDWTDDGGLLHRPLLTAEQARGLQRHGLELGAHTRTHVSLPDASDETVEDEVAGSRIELERILGQSVTTLAYPFGRRDPRAVAAARRAGYTGACTVAGRPVRLSDDPFEVPRIEIVRGDSLHRFLRKLWFGAA
jgi:peptidoglycan/xylan/chitin deacetylase (PgdA/CDA1 family)